MLQSTAKSHGYPSNETHQVSTEDTTLLLQLFTQGITATSRALTLATQQPTEVTFQPIQNSVGMFSPCIIKLVICWQYVLN